MLVQQCEGTQERSSEGATLLLHAVAEAGWQALTPPRRRSTQRPWCLQSQTRSRTGWRPAAATAGRSHTCEAGGPQWQASGAGARLAQAQMLERRVRLNPTTAATAASSPFTPTLTHIRPPPQAYPLPPTPAPHTPAPRQDDLHHVPLLLHRPPQRRHDVAQASHLQPTGQRQRQ